MKELKKTEVKMSSVHELKESGKQIKLKVGNFSEEKIDEKKLEDNEKKDEDKSEEKKSIPQNNFQNLLQLLLQF